MKIGNMTIGELNEAVLNAKFTSFGLSVVGDQVRAVSELEERPFIDHDIQFFPNPL